MRPDTADTGMGGAVARLADQQPAVGQFSGLTGHFGAAVGDSRLRSPIGWLGGKSRMLAKIVPNLPPHGVYVEPFGGGAAVLLAKTPAPVEIYNDINPGLVNMFRTIRDPGLFERFYRRVQATLYSRSEYYCCQNTWMAQDDPVEKAYRFYVAARQSFGGHFDHGWGYNVATSMRGMAAVNAQWNSIAVMLPELHRRLAGVQIKCEDWRQILGAHDLPDSLAYLDPPYVLDTRKGGGYEHELTDGDHRDLVEAMLRYSGMMVLSGYESSIYAPLLDAGWTIRRYNTACFVVGRTRFTKIQGAGAAIKMQPRVECVYSNPAANENKRQLSLFGEATT